jgi:hypothetical protein
MINKLIKIKLIMAANITFYWTRDVLKNNYDLTRPLND